MGKGKVNRDYGSKPERRLRVCVLLTGSEADELERAARESGAASRSLVVSEAVKTGLLNAELKLRQEGRCRRVDVWIPRRDALEFKQLAQKQGLTQAHLLRHFLFQYLADPPWKSPETNRGQEAAAT